MFFEKLTNDGKIILKNFSYLSLMRLFNIGIKFLLVAYLIRVLGERDYGVVTWLDSIVQYFLMIINFGFNIYAAKYIVDVGGDEKKTNEIISAIYAIKSLLFVFSMLCVFALSFYSALEPYRGALLLLMCMGIGEVLFPIWFYQGKENLKPATIIVFVSRLFLFLGVLIFLNAENGILIYISLLFVSSLIMGVMGTAQIFKNYSLSLTLVKTQKIIFYVKEAVPFFLGRFMSLIFNFGTIFLIGKFCEFEQVSGFDIGLKVIMVGVIPFEMLQQAVFPSLARTKNKNLLRKILVLSLICGILISIVIYFFADEFLLLFGGDSMVEFSSTLKTLAIAAPFIACTFILGSCALVAFGHFKEYNFSLIVTSLIYFLIVLVLYFSGQLKFWNLVYLRVFGDVFMCLLRFYFVMKKNVLNLNLTE